MRDVLSDIERWRAEGQPVAIATVVETWGSAPRPAGGKMALTADGRIAGSVSGGCVENAVVEAGKKTLASGKPQLLHYGVSDDTAWSVGLACGGSLDVFVEPLDPAIFAPVEAAIRGEKPVAVATVIRGPEGEVGRKLALFEDGSVRGEIDEAALSEARSALSEGASRRVKTEARELFVDVLLPAPRLVIVGGVHIAVTLVSLAKTLGFRTILVDPREAFGNAKRFPHADEIVNDWPDKALARIAPDGSTAIAVLDARSQARRSGAAGRAPEPCLLRRGPGLEAHAGKTPVAPQRGRDRRGRSRAAARADRTAARRPLARGDRGRDPGRDRGGRETARA